MATIAVLGTCDTKGDELGLIAQTIRARGHRALVIDVGTLDPPRIAPDHTREEVAQASGLDLAQLVQTGDRGLCVAAMARAAPTFLARLEAEGKIQGVIAIGGGCGASIGVAAMRGLPLAIPRIMVSTMITHEHISAIGMSGIVVFPSILDLSGLNRITSGRLVQAAGAIVGMVEAHSNASSGRGRPLVAASMFGNTTACVNSARARLEQEGYEVLVFHANGVGGRTMEQLIVAEPFAGVLDLTTTEWADELVGGILSAGPTRLDAAAQARVPAVIAPGCLDMVNFAAPETVPERFRGRRFYAHNPQTTLMRTTAQECRELGRILAAKINAYSSPVRVLLPLLGLSQIGAPGGPFHDPEADQALFDSLKSALHPRIPILELPCPINHPDFAHTAAQQLLAIMRMSQEPIV